MIEHLEAFVRSINCKGILIADSKGVILQVEESFNKDYAIGSRDLIGRSVYELEREGIFRPSSVAKVLKTGQEVTIIQKVQGDMEVIVTAFPVKDEKNNIVKVVTFSRELSEYEDLKKWFDELNREFDFYKRKLGEISASNEIIEGIFTCNSHFAKTLRNIHRLAKYDVSLLLLGETGVGKTLIANKIHTLSSYGKGRFVEVNCGAIHQGLIELELFGYEKGSFTGADKEGKKGLFEVANNGTLFLDEIAELPLEAQAKLLKVLQDKTIRRVGGTEDITVNCRIIAATNKNLEEEVKNKRFREDLLYRLNVAVIDIMPLRERKEDIFFLSQLFISQFNKKYGLKKILSHSLIEQLNKYNWPGNIRELENVIHRMTLTSEDNLINENLLPDYIKLKTIGSKNKLITDNINQINDLDKAIEEYEGTIIRTMFKKYNSSTTLAKALNISQTTASRKIRKHVK